MATCKEQKKILSSCSYLHFSWTLFFACPFFDGVWILQISEIERERRILQIVIQMQKWHLVYMDREFFHENLPRIFCGAFKTNTRRKQEARATSYGDNSNGVKPYGIIHVGIGGFFSETLPPSFRQRFSHGEDYRGGGEKGRAVGRESSTNFVLSAGGTFCGAMIAED